MPTKPELVLELETLKEKVKTRIEEAILTGEICEDGGKKALREFGLLPAARAEGTVNLCIRFNNLLDPDEYEDNQDELAQIVLSDVIAFLNSNYTPSLFDVVEYELETLDAQIWTQGD